MLEVVDIHDYDGKSPVLHGISMAVWEGAVVTPLGRNGMGYTTTIWTAIGFTPPRSGVV